MIADRRSRRSPGAHWKEYWEGMMGKARGAHDPPQIPGTHRGGGKYCGLRRPTCGASRTCQRGRGRVRALGGGGANT